MAADPTRSWALVEEPGEIRLTVWGMLGPAEIAALDRRLATPVASLRIDLTGVTELHTDAVGWLGARRPSDVVVVAGGAVHRRLREAALPLTLE